MGYGRVNAESGFYDKREWIAFVSRDGPAGRYHSRTVDARIDQ